MIENRRKSELGLFGEIVVCEQLGNNRWYNCTRIGNFSPCFDIQAFKEGTKYLFSVKTRNHTRYNNELKTDGYNLFYNKMKGGDPDSRVQTAMRIAEQQNAIPMWAAVTVDVVQRKYDICYGAVVDLENKKKIPMGPMDRIRHKKLAENVTDQRINPRWSNVKRKRGHEARGGTEMGDLTAAAKNRITIFGPKDDGTYVVEFRTSDGQVLTTSIPRAQAHVIRHFQEQIPYGLFVPEAAGFPSCIPRRGRSWRCGGSDVIDSN